jgi:hypothetical protein
MSATAALPLKSIPGIGDVTKLGFEDMFLEQFKSPPEMVGDNTRIITNALTGNSHPLFVDREIM